MAPERKMQISVAVLAALLAGGAVVFWMLGRQRFYPKEEGTASVAKTEAKAADAPDPELQRKLERLRSLAAGVSGDRKSVPVSVESDSSVTDLTPSQAQHFKSLSSIGAGSGKGRVFEAGDVDDGRRERLLLNLERMRQNGTSDKVREILDRRKSDISSPSTDMSAGE